ncbi:MAG: TonB-dependent receptor [Longimonas sp.]|uniref:TonB-dependent receptor domain-containing protein n=1 Tax=Longimonas sp. TaxID=2039626 RepID=UPI0039766E61
MHKSQRNYAWKVLTAAIALVIGWAGVSSQAFHAYAQSENAVIEGVVQDSNGAPLPGANVVATAEDDASRTAGVATDTEGAFQLSVSSGTYTVEVSIVGYESATQTVTVNDGATESLTFALNETAVSLNEILVQRTSLTGGLRNLDGIPGSAQYISPEELDTHSYTDVHRVLGSVPGVYTVEEDGYGLRANIGMRGTGAERSSKITVMEDGVLAAPAPYSAPAAYYFPTIGRAHAVEVRKGSSQIKSGPYTTGGAFNMLSTPIPDDFSGQVNAIAGSDEERRLHAYAGDSFEHFGYVVETFQSGADGFKDITGFQNADAGLDYSTGFDKQDYLAKARVNTGTDARIPQSLTFTATRTTETSNETYLGLTQADFETSPFQRYAGSQNDQMNTEHSRLQAQHVIQPAEGLDITTTLYRTDFHRNWYKLDSVDGVGISSLLSNPNENSEALARVQGRETGGSLLVKNNNREYYTQGIQTAIGYDVTSGSTNHSLEIGGRYHEDEIDRFQWEDEYRMADRGVMELISEGIPGTESNRLADATAWAGYAEYTLERGPFTVTPGVRVEDFELTRTAWDTDTEAGRNRTASPTGTEQNTGTVWIPGLGIDYRINSGWSAFAGVHRGFAVPGTNPETDPENSVNYEVGTRYDARGLRTEVVGFFNDYTNLLGRDLAAIGGDPSGETFNGGEARVFGLEFTGAYNLGLPLNTSFSIPLEAVYTYTNSEFSNTFDSDFGPWGEVEEGFKLPYLPEHKLALNAGVEDVYGFDLRLTGRFTDEVRTVAGSGDPASSNRIDSHFVMDLSAEYALSNHARIFGSVRNLADNEYAVARRPAGLRPGMPRTFLIGVKTSF